MQLLIFNEEFLVSACHQRALITSLPFVHTARRSYRLNDPVRPPDWGDAFGSPDATLREAVQTLLFRGRRSRNKVSVGEPAEGSLPVSIPNPVRTNSFGFLNGRCAGSGRGAVLRVLAQAVLLGRCGRVSWACGRASASHFYGKGNARVDRELPPCLSSPTAGWSAPPHPTARARARLRFLRGPACARAYHNPNNNSCRRISWLPQR